jgi:transcriptional regulator with XRE-family HTH domain
MKKLRQSSGLDQQAVAKKMGFTSTYLSLLESGHRNWSHPLMVAFRSACKP